MRKQYDMSDAERSELARIDAMAGDVRKMRERFFNRLRQRAYRKARLTTEAR